jgi:putative transposase
MSLPDVVHRFKSLTTARYRHGVYERGWQPFPGRLWQRNYYEHIIRNERALQRIREYIMNNPARWDLDIENPDYPQHGKPMDLDQYYASIWGEPP